MSAALDGTESRYFDRYEPAGVSRRKSRKGGAAAKRAADGIRSACERTGSVGLPGRGDGAVHPAVRSEGGGAPRGDRCFGAGDRGVVEEKGRAHEFAERFLRPPQRDDGANRKTR